MNERHIRHNHLLPSFLPSSLHGSFIENEKANRCAWPTYIRITITKAHLLYRRPIRYSAHACRMKLCISHFSTGRLTIRPWRSSPWMPFVEKPRNYPSANLSGSCVIQVWSLPPSSSRPPTPSPPGLFNLVSHPALSLSKLRVSSLPSPRAILSGDWCLNWTAGSPWGKYDRAAGRIQGRCFCASSSNQWRI